MDDLSTLNFLSNLTSLVVMICVTQVNSCARLQHSFPFVSWNSSTGCDPSVCGICQISDIQGTDGKLPISLATRMALFDTARFRQLMTNKRVTLLGDSTMGETAHEWAILLSGIGGRKNLLESYMRQGSRVRGNSQVCIPFDASSNVSDLLFTTTVSPEEACINGTKVLFFGNHRDMTIKVEYLNFCLRHRFTGHHLVQSNDGGLATFFEPSFQNELNELFDNPCQDGKPDFLVINSGLHDFPPKINRTREEYEKQLRDLAVILVGLQNRGTKVIWKGNYGPWSIVRNSWTNTIPQEIMNASNITYADCESVLSHLLYYHDIDMFSEDHIHFGAISFYIAENHSMLVSSMIIQKVIGEIISNISSGGE